MVAFFRQFLVVLLVLLQNAAPLMHAHTGLEGKESGLHLYEFEDLRLATDHSIMSVANFAHDTNNCIVSVGSAIKQTDTYHICKLFFGLITHATDSSNVNPADFLQFSRLITEVAQQTLPNPNPSRAPPFYKS
jgi:hypothetical protein